MYTILIIILILIQLGGLGLMTFAALVLSVLGLPIGLRHHSFLREDLNQTSLHQLGGLIKTGQSQSMGNQSAPEPDNPGPSCYRRDRV